MVKLGTESLNRAPSKNTYLRRQIIAASAATLVLYAIAAKIDSATDTSSCVTTEGAADVWGNAQQATHMLRANDIRVDDIRDISFELDTLSGPAVVCYDEETLLIPDIVTVQPLQP